MPAPVSIKGIEAFSQTKEMSPLLPRGINKSIYSFLVISSLVVSLEVDSINKTISEHTKGAILSLMIRTNSLLVSKASLPPFKTQALPDLIQREPH